jgi:hypothetical protein
MFPPHRSFAIDSQLPGVVLYVQIGHRTWIGANGAVFIRSKRTGLVEVDRPGADGGRIEAGTTSN